MRISTKKIFRTLKNSPKKKNRTTQKSSKLSTKFLSFNNLCKMDNSKIKKNLFSKSIYQTEKNPFKRTQNYTCKNKRKAIKRGSSQIKNIGINIVNKNDDFLEDSFINNLLLTNETVSNLFDKNIKTENNQNKKKEEDIDTLCNLFKNSKLNTAFAIDNKDNNNLNNEQKQIIDHYFNQKDKDGSNKKINTIPVQKYKENKALFEVKSS